MKKVTCYEFHFKTEGRLMLEIIGKNKKEALHKARNLLARWIAEGQLDELFSLAETSKVREGSADSQSCDFIVNLLDK